MVCYIILSSHSILIMKFITTVKVVPHAGGVGLCEMVHHLQMWDFTSLSGTKQDRYVEYVDQQHEQFINPVIVENAHYMASLVRYQDNRQLKNVKILNEF